MNVHALLAAAVNVDGHREILGLHVTSAEDGAGWLAFFRDLTARGLTGVKLVTSMRTAAWSRPSHDPARSVLARLIRQHGGWREVPAGSAPPSGEDLGSVTRDEVQRQTCPSRRWRISTGQWESCPEQDSGST